MSAISSMTTPGGTSFRVVAMVADVQGAATAITTRLRARLQPGESSGDFEPIVVVAVEGPDDARPVLARGADLVLSFSAVDRDAVAELAPAVRRRAFTLLELTSIIAAMPPRARRAVTSSAEVGSAGFLRSVVRAAPTVRHLAPARVDLLDSTDRAADAAVRARAALREVERLGTALRALDIP